MMQAARVPEREGGCPYRQSGVPKYSSSVPPHALCSANASCHFAASASLARRCPSLPSGLPASRYCLPFRIKRLRSFTSVGRTTHRGASSIRIVVGSTVAAASIDRRPEVVGGLFLL